MRFADRRLRWMAACAWLFGACVEVNDDDDAERETDAATVIEGSQSTSSDAATSDKADASVPDAALCSGADVDGDGLGNACDGDDDGDGFTDDDDPAPLDANIPGNFGTPESILNDPRVKEALAVAKAKGVEIATHTELTPPNLSGLYLRPASTGKFVATGDGSDIGLSIIANEGRLEVGADNSVVSCKRRVHRRKANQLLHLARRNAARERQRLHHLLALDGHLHHQRSVVQDLVCGHRIRNARHADGQPHRHSFARRHHRNRGHADQRLRETLRGQRRTRRWLVSLDHAAVPETQLLRADVHVPRRRQSVRAHRELEACRRHSVQVHRRVQGRVRLTELALRPSPLSEANTWNLDADDWAANELAGQSTAASWAGVFVGWLESSGARVSATTELQVSKGKISERYSFADKSESTEGALSMCVHLRVRAIRCTRQDRYGTGDLEPTLSSDGTMIAGHWRAAHDSTWFEWNGARVDSRSRQKAASE